MFQPHPPQLPLHSLSSFFLLLLAPQFCRQLPPDSPLFSYCTEGRLTCLICYFSLLTRPPLPLSLQPSYFANGRTRHFPPSPRHLPGCLIDGTITLILPDSFLLSLTLLLYHDISRSVVTSFLSSIFVSNTLLHFEQAISSFVLCHPEHPDTLQSAVLTSFHSFLRFNRSYTTQTRLQFFSGCQFSSHYPTVPPVNLSPPVSLRRSFTLHHFTFGPQSFVSV